MADHEPVLSTAEAAAALNERGYKITKNVLRLRRENTRKSEGPPFYRFGEKHVVYKLSDLLAWAESRLTRVE